jgi:hypothetical protein
MLLLLLDESIHYLPTPYKTVSTEYSSLVVITPASYLEGPTLKS